MSFIDRLATNPGRFTLTDITTQATQTVDIARADGPVTQEGTILNSNGFDRALESYFDAGQEVVDIITALLAGSQTMTGIASGVVKYGTALGLSIVALTGATATSAVAAGGLVASGLASGTSPSAAIESPIRSDGHTRLRLTTDGSIYAVDAIPAGADITTEFVWEVG